MELNMLQLIIFGIISIISLIIMIFLLIEEDDLLDLPLIPLFFTITISGVIGIILSIININFIYILIVILICSLVIFLITYFGIKSITTKPDDLKKYIGKKARVEISIDNNSTGRIQIADNNNNESFPAKSDTILEKNQEVKIIKFNGTIAFVQPLKKMKNKNLNKEFNVCSNCKATIDIGNKICPYCGEKII